MKILLKSLILAVGLLISINGITFQGTRALKFVTLTGSGYELGLQHGKSLKKEIADIVSAWKQNTTKALGKDADVVISEFFEYAQFESAIKKWTPELFEEVRGIADGSEQALNNILVLNLLDEFWVYVNNLSNHHCSGVGVPAMSGNPGYISQNMDLENYTDGFQVLMRLNRTANRPEQLILTHPGLIGLNGLNEEGVGVCVNTLMQLNASATGLPVAFVVRRIINSTDKDELLNFVQSVNHASGQNYILGIKGEVFDFEASANKVVQFTPENENGTVYHTNHPIVNNDVKPWFKQFDPNLPPLPTNSQKRLSAVEKRMTSSLTIGEDLIKEALRSRDDENHPVCRSNDQNGYGFTFASIIMTLTGTPHIQIIAGPPDEGDYARFDFSTKL